MEPEKPALSDLQHYGVLGMKWGRTRARASSSAIRVARTNVAKDKAAVGKAEMAVYKAKTPKERAAAQKTHAEVTAKMLKNPDRVVAARLTRGEKAASFLLLTPVGAGALIGATSAVSRRVERKQELGKYNKKN